MSEFDKSVYNEHYYQTSFGGIPYNRTEKDGHWVKFFTSIADEIKQRYNPKRVLDVGCAKGFLVEALRDLGINAYGFDISEIAIEEVREDIKPFCTVGSVNDPEMYQGHYDLILCIEILEHVPEEMAETTIKLMCEHSNTVLFSSSPDDFDEPTHINVRPAEYWDDFFAKYGFSRAHEVWPSQSIAPQTVMYRKEQMENVVKGLDAISSIDLKIEKSQATTEIILNKVNPLPEQINSLVQQNNSLSNQNSAFIANTGYQLNELGALVKTIHQQIESMNAENTENLILKRELLIIQEENQKLLHEINNLKEVIVSANIEKESIGNHVRNLESTTTILQDQLNMIKSGTAFRYLSKYWNTRDRLLPLGSRRREVVKSLLGRKSPSTLQGSQSLPITEHTQVDYWSIGFQQWLKKTTLNSEDISSQLRSIKELQLKPIISILLPVYKIPVDVFKETIGSVVEQSYSKWELCIAFGDPSGIEIIDYVRELANQDKRVKFTILGSNGGISLNTNACMELATGEFIGLLDHDDLITKDALYRMVEYINKYSDADFLYSDKDQILEDGQTRLNPLFKHGWSWPTMFSANYPTHFCVIRTELIHQVGKFDKETDGAQDWDIFLKVSNLARRIVHVPYVLYHWRIISTSVASGLQAKPYVTAAQIKTLNNYIDRMNIDAELVRNEEDHTFRIVWKDHDDNQYDVLIFGDKGSTLADFQRTVQSMKKQKIAPRRYITLSESHLDKLGYNDRAELLNVCSLSELINAMDNDHSNVKLFIIKAGVSVDSNEAAYEMSRWLDTNEYTSVSGLIKNKNGLVANAGYVISKDHQIISPFKDMNLDGYTTYGSVKWYRQYLAVSEQALMVKGGEFGNYINQQGITKSNIESLVFNYQISRNVDGSKSSLYNPYLSFTSFYDNEEINVVTKEKISDPYYNQAVWDWNPQYMVQTLGKHNENKSPQQDNSIWSGYTNDAIILSTLYDFSEADLENNRKTIQNNTIGIQEAKSAIWFLPPFSSAFYGGIHTILRFAEYLKTENGVTNRFVIVGTKDIEPIKDSISAAFPTLSECYVTGLVNEREIGALPSSDMSFCTLWTTAYMLLKYNKTKRKFYFLQDWEPLFYPGGTTSAQVEVTYEFGFTAICNTVSLKESYEELGGNALYFTPAVDTSVFYPIEGMRDDEQFLIFLYGRPGNPRNCFELAIPALKKVKEHFGDKVRIVSAGADWNPSAYGADGVIEHLGMLPYKKTADLYRRCHIGVAMMMTRHPSYLPFELMACGSLVVANDNRWNKWLLKNGENCILSKPTVTCLSNDIIAVLDDKVRREKLAKSGTENVLIKHSDWDKEFKDLLVKLL